MDGPWSDDDLDAALDLFEAGYVARGFGKGALNVYVGDVRRFLRWRRESRHPEDDRSLWTQDDLAADLKVYLEERRAEGKSEATVRTNDQAVRRFLAWLSGETRERPRREAGRPRQARAAAVEIVPQEPASLADLLWAREQFHALEPRDLFYRIATDLVARALASGSPRDLAEGLAVLLLTWNDAYYRYRRLTEDHLVRLEGLLVEHRTALEDYRERSLASLGPEDDVLIAHVFSDFEDLLGPVGAAKGLHLLAPSFFAIWDNKIAAAYGCRLVGRGSNARPYRRFLAMTQAQVVRLSREPGAPDDLVKALDECNYVRFTKGLGPRWVSEP